MALLVITVWFLSMKKNISYVVLPAVFMLVTTMAALIYSVTKYARTKDYLLAGMAAALLVLSFYLLYEILIFIRRRKNA